MRMRKRNNLEPRMEACSAIWIRDGKERKGKWRELMPEAKEIRLEVGCGKGKFTVETAEQHPDILFLAVECVREAMLLGMERALQMGLKNLFFLSIDAAELEEYFEDSEIDLLYLNFSDPWPKKRTARRRLPSREFPTISCRCITITWVLIRLLLLLAAFMRIIPKPLRICSTAWRSKIEQTKVKSQPRRRLAFAIFG